MLTYATTVLLVLTFPKCTVQCVVQPPNSLGFYCVFKHMFDTCNVDSPQQPFLAAYSLHIYKTCSRLKTASYWRRYAAIGRDFLTKNSSE